jgi:phage FluMu gp28-like protein
VGENVQSEPARPRPIIPLLPYQQADLEAEDRFRWNCWARQTGKSFTKSLRRILRGIARRRNQIFLSAGERQSRELMQKARQHCQALKIACDHRAPGQFDGLKLQQLEIMLPHGVRIVALPANPDTARGYTGDLLLDEFAMHAHDREIWAAIFPSLLRGRGELDVASTPKGKSNMFYELQHNEMFAKSLVTLPDAIAQGLDADAEQMRVAMGDEELYRQEFLCEFLDEATAFLTYEQIAGCVDHSLVVYDNVADLAREQRDLYVGVDIGRLRDLTVLWVLTQHVGPASQYVGTTVQSVATDLEVRPTDWKQLPARPFITIAVIELAHCPFREQFEMLSQVLSMGNVRGCCIDAGGIGMQLAEQAVERFGGHRVEPVVFTSATKSELAGDLRIAVESRGIVIPSDDRIRNDWHSLRRTMTESGHFRLSAPRVEGSHADRFWAAALALRAAQRKTGMRPESIAIKPLQFARKGTW